ncbi:MAG: VOC family protein [Actinomycetota bacterium]|nr:VOC family protein [Actinomycetota bacterium]
MQLDHVGLSVADLDAQAAWYCRAFGLLSSTPFEISAIGLRGVFVIGDGGLAIELLQRRGSRPGLQAPDPATALLTRGYGHICLRVADVDATHAAALAQGAEERMPPQASPEPGVRMSYLGDPEGNLIELVDRTGPVGSGPAGSGPGPI